MDLDSITPLILTYNEQPNIGRCLDRLRWAKRIVVIDSGSTDDTPAICAGFPNVELIPHAFVTFADQCNFGIRQITSQWVLSLDSDYILPPDFAERIASLRPTAPIAGYQFPFRYCVHGRPLRASLYPARTVLYRRASAVYEVDGHGHKVRIDGTVQPLPWKIDHDDRKSLAHWLASQRKYALLEAAKLDRDARPSSLPDRLRRRIWPAVPAVFVYTLIAKRLILDGWPGWFYALQRTYAELLLSLELLDRRLNAAVDRNPHERPND